MSRRHIILDKFILLVILSGHDKILQLVELFCPLQLSDNMQRSDDFIQYEQPVSHRCFTLWFQHALMILARSNYSIEACNRIFLYKSDNLLALLAACIPYFLNCLFCIFANLFCGHVFFFFLLICNRFLICHQYYTQNLSISQECEFWQAPTDVNLGLLYILCFVLEIFLSNFNQLCGQTLLFISCFSDEGTEAEKV